MSSPTTKHDTVVSPYVEGVLPADHQAELVKIRTCFKAWLLAFSDSRKKIAGARERLGAATQDLSDLKVEELYAFTPSPPYTFRRVLLSCTRCYWLALIASFTPSEREEMAKRLDCLPPYGERVPQYNGSKCVEKPGELDAREYEGLMRTMHLVVLGMVSKDVMSTWNEIGEVGVMNWEESD